MFDWYLVYGNAYMRGYIKQLGTLLSIKSTCCLADCAFKIFDMFSGDLILSTLLNFTWYIRLMIAISDIQCTASST